MNKTVLALLVNAALMANYAYADEDSVQLDEVQVRDRSFSQDMGTQKFTADQIKNMPARNGNITELLRANPNVDFSTSSDNSTNGGDIRPDEVSFHGEKFYNNNFIIDGMSNNDNLNPAGGLYDPGNRNAYGLPEGGTQSLWLDTSLLKSVEVFDSNISAKYGRFTGGVVDAKLKDPDFERWNSGKIFYRTTRDTWASFHIDDDKREAFEKASRLDQHPKYTKHIYGFTVNQKLSEKASMYLTYSKTVSDIQYYHPTMRYVDELGNPIGGSVYEPQRRTSEKILWRGVYLPDNGDLWRLTAIYEPHEARMVHPNRMNGGMKTVGGGFQTNIEWEKQFDWAKMTSYLGYKRTGDEVNNDTSDYHNYHYVKGLFGWKADNNLSSVGGNGKVYTQKEMITAKQDFDLTELEWRDTQHKLSFGWEYQYALAKYERVSGANNYTYSLSNRVQCNGADNCFDNQQYASSRLYYFPRQVKVNDTNISAYIQDKMEWKRLEMTGGLRVDYNQYTGNTDFSPRFSASYDVFGDQSTRIFGGAGRYYGASILANKLREGIGENLRYRRSVDSNGVISDWAEPVNGYGTVPSHYMSTRVKTPYSDEGVLGFQQKLFDTNVTFKWVGRKSRDGLTSVLRNVNGRTYRVMTNEGSTNHDSFSVTINPIKGYSWKYAELHWGFSASKKISKSANSRTYDEDADDSSRIIYQGKLLDAGERPNSDFNTPWQFAFGLETKFPAINLTWHQDFSYRKGRKYFEVTDTKRSCTESSLRSICGDYEGLVDYYRDAQKGSEFTVDWRFIYSQPLTGHQSIEITADINNVLNRKTIAKSASGTTTYKMGRNFWLGASYNW